MRGKIVPAVLCPALWVFLPVFAGAQQSVDSANPAIRAYMLSSLYNTSLYTGPEYFPFRGRIPKDHIYFLSDSLKDASVVYDHRVYTDVMMIYDLYTDQPVVRVPSINIRIALQPAKVNDFYIEGHHFQGFSDTSTIKPGNGFWEVLYDGRVKAYAKYSKELLAHAETEANGGLTYEVIPKTRLRLVRDGVSWPVDGTSGLWKSFGDRADEVRKYARRNNLRYKKNKLQELAALAAYYDQKKP